MSASLFGVKTHVFPGQHIRQYPGATRHSEEDVLYLEAKQYIPKSNSNPRDGDITVIGATAVSFPKELYEPLWDDLLLRCERTGLRIRSIWITECSNEGANGELNEATQGDDPNYGDYSRDMLLMVNTFRQEFHQPIVGVAHSVGATAMLQLSRFHPRLLAATVAIDPIIGDAIRLGPALIASAARRPDLWPSREAAEQTFRESKFMGSWDSRVLELWLKYGLRDTPTLLYPEAGGVTLRTTKAQEAWNYSRPCFDVLTVNGEGTVTPKNRIKYPDYDSTMMHAHPFYRPEAWQIWEELPLVRPDVLYVYPKQSPTATVQFVKAMVDRTGAGRGGSGGEKEGRVASVFLEGAGHLAPFEKPTDCAEAISIWLAKDLQAWQERREYERSNRDDKSIDKIALSETWISEAKGVLDKFKRSNTPKL